MTGVTEVMTGDIISIDMDTTVGTAMDVCSEKRIRHLPVVDDKDRLAGLVTDRDLRYAISPRIGTISENNSDRESLTRLVHLIMVRDVVTASPQTSLPKAAADMLEHRVGCLPVLDSGRRVVGIVTTSDLLSYMAQHRSTS
jgi:CBS-domain-containing membrane protein